MFFFLIPSFHHVSLGTFHRHPVGVRGEPNEHLSASHGRWCCGPNPLTVSPLRLFFLAAQRRNGSHGTMRITCAAAKARRATARVGPTPSWWWWPKAEDKWSTSTAHVLFDCLPAGRLIRGMAFRGGVVFRLAVFFGWRWVPRQLAPRQRVRPRSRSHAGPPQEIISAGSICPKTAGTTARRRLTGRGWRQQRLALGSGPVLPLRHRRASFHLPPGSSRTANWSGCLPPAVAHSTSSLGVPTTEKQRAEILTMFVSRF